MKVFRGILSLLIKLHVYFVGIKLHNELTFLEKMRKFSHVWKRKNKLNEFYKNNLLALNLFFHIYNFSLYFSQNFHKHNVEINLNLENSILVCA